MVNHAVSRMSGEDAIAQANAHAAKTIGAWPA